MLPTQLVPDEQEGKILRVRLIQKEGKQLFDPTYLFDEGSTVSWIPCGRKLTCSYPGIKMFYGPDTYYGEEVRAGATGCERAHACGCVWGGRAGAAVQARAHPACSPDPPTHPPTPPSPPLPPSPPTPTLHRCLCWRWTASLTSLRS